MERISSFDKIPFSFVQCSSKYIKDIEAGNKTIQEGAVYFVLDTKQIFLGKNNNLISMGKGSGIIFALKETDLNNLDPNVSFNLQDLEEEYQANYPQPNDLIFNKDGCFYRVLEIDNTQIKTIRLTVAGGGSGGGGGVGGASSIILAAYATDVDDTIVYGDSCEIQYEFWATMDGVSTGSGVREIIINGITKERKNIPQSTTDNPYQIIDISKYLEPGDNFIQLKCSDVYGNYKILQFSRAVVKLEIDDSNLTAKNTKKIFATENDSFTYTYIPYGIGEKIITFTLKKDDGTTTQTLETFTTSGSERNKTFSNLAYGVYTLEVSMTTTVNGKDLTPVQYFYTILCAANPPDPLTEFHQPIIASYLPIQEVSQGSQIEFYYMLNDPAKKTNSSVKLVIKYKDSFGVIKTYSVSNSRIVNSLVHDIWRERNYPLHDEVYFSIRYDYTDAMTGQEISLSSQEWKVKVNASEMDNNISSSGLLLSLSANGRTNNEDKNTINQWIYNSITTDFENVNWVNDNNSGTGWLSDVDKNSVLRLNGRASATVNFYPFKYETTSSANNLIGSGYTLELDFAIRDVNNKNAIAINCMDKENVGFKVSANKITFRGRTGTELSSHFNEEERVKVTFVVESNAKTPDGEYVTSRLISIYLNGVLSSAQQYAPEETFQQVKPLGITFGSPDCSIDIYNIRAYNRALTSKEIVNNFIYDISNIATQSAYYENNDVYDDYNQLSYTKLKEKNSIMTIIGDLPSFKGDKKKVTIKYECLFNKDFDFEDDANLDVQGTSSQLYIRKNYKIKCDSEHQHGENQLPNKVFCLKADYAESTSTHNTQNANLVHTFYTEETPAQKDDKRCRTSIYGYPIIVFHQKTLESTPEFIGKYNFNFDKGSEEVFGFTEAYDVECWEFCNNDSNACNFLGPIAENWKDDFEPRYLAPFTINQGTEDELEISFDRIEELQEKETLTDKEKAELKTQREKAIERFKTMHNWVVSTKDDIDKFKNEFEQYFDLHYCLIYYVYTFVALMVDQRAKNMFLTYWGKTNKWQPWFYDNDTCFGLNNVGKMTYEYYHEDTDKYGNGNVYNGQESVLWTNFRECFPTEIRDTYARLRSEKLISYNNFIDRFIENGSNKWSETVYNEDTEYKYIYPLKSEEDSSHLTKIQGTGEEYLRYFIDKRLNYCDSKWNCGDYVDDTIALRFYTPDTWEGIAPDPTITVTPFTKMYTGVRYKANGTLKQQRTEADKTATFSPESSDYEEGEYEGKFNDTEVAIYGASNLSSIGDLSACYLGSIDIGKAVRLTELKVGNSTEGYYNNLLKEVNIGTNKLLKKVDFTNCVELRGNLDLSNCPNIEEIKTFGTKLSSVSLSSSGHITKLYLPETIFNLTLSNQSFIEDFQIQTLNDELSPYRNLREILIINCPTIDSQKMLEEIVDNFSSEYVSIKTTLSAPSGENLLINIYADGAITTEIYDEQTSSSAKTIYKFIQDHGDNSTSEDLRYFTVVYKEENDTIVLNETFSELIAALNNNDKIYLGGLELTNIEQQGKYLDIGFINIDWDFENADFLLSLLDNENIRGKHPETNVIDPNMIWITGTCHIKKLNGEEMKKLKSNYPEDLKITYDDLTANLSFYLGGDTVADGENAYYHYNYTIGDTITSDEYLTFRQIWIDNKGIDCTQENLSEYFTLILEENTVISGTCKKNVEIIRDLFIPIQIAATQEILNGGNGFNPVGKEIEAPKKASTAKYDYTFSGWAYRSGAVANDIILNNIEQNTKVYATFTKTIKKYPVYFYNDPLKEGKAPIKSLIGDQMIAYGNGVPTNEIPPNPEYPDESLKQDYTFTGWDPNPTKITGETHCQAQYSYTAYSPVRLIERDIVEFSSNTLTDIGDYAFYNCAELEIVNTPFVLSIGQFAFEGCSVLDTLILLNNEQVCTLGTNALKGTLIEQNKGSIYVADNMVELYQNHSDWNNYKDYIKSINELTILEVNE